MERSMSSKWKKIYDEDGGSPPIDDDDASLPPQKALGDEQPLVHHDDEPSGYAGPPPLLTQKPVATWAVGGLGALFLIVVVLVVRGGTLQAPRVVQNSVQTAEWVELLPSDVAAHIDRDVDPCDDFYEFSCGSWQKQTQIPNDRPSVFLSFSTVTDENQKVLKDVMQQGWPLVGELYDSCVGSCRSRE